MENELIRENDEVGGWRSPLAHFSMLGLQAEVESLRHDGRSDAAETLLQNLERVLRRELEYQRAEKPPQDQEDR